MKLLKTFSVYTAASFINKGMMFAIFPFLTNVISPQQNGILSLYSIFVMFVIPFNLLGFSNSIVMEYTKLDAKEYKSFFSSSLFLSTVSFIILLLAFFLSGNTVALIVGAPYTLLLWGLLYSYLNIYFEGILAYLRTIDKPGSFFLITVCKTALEISLIIWLVVYARRGAEGKVLSSLIATAAVAVFSLCYFLSQNLLVKNVQKKYINMEWKFGISQIFFQLNLFVLASADKYIIGHMLHDISGLGIYFVATQLAFIINVIVTAFFLSYQPLLYTYLSDLNVTNKYKLLKIKYTFTIFLFICTLLMCFATPLFYHLFVKNQVYHAGIIYVAWNAFAFFFWGLYALFLGYLYYYRKNKVVIIFSIFSSAVCISLNYFFINQFRIMGAAYANLLTYFILFIAIFITVQRELKIKMPWFQFRTIFSSQL
jgi:O-antigen/teichoic acid export membrane protein